MRKLRTDQSSNIFAVSHNKRKQQLTITFIDKTRILRKPGAVYIYKPVSAETAQQLINAASVGKYFIAHIRNNRAITYRVK